MCKPKTICLFLPKKTKRCDFLNQNCQCEKFIAMGMSSHTVMDYLHLEQSLYIVHVCADGPFTGPQIGVGWGGVGCDSIHDDLKI